MLKLCFHECRSRMILIGDDLAESITVLERNGYRQSRDRAPEGRRNPRDQRSRQVRRKLVTEIACREKSRRDEKTIPRMISGAESRDAKREIAPIGTRTSSDKNANNGLLFSLSLLPDRRRFISLESRASMLTAAEILQHSILSVASRWSSQRRVTPVNVREEIWKARSQQFCYLPWHIKSISHA